MTDMNPNSPDNRPSRGAIDKAVAFLKRDVRTFLPGWQQQAVAEPVAAATTNVEADIPSLVDPGKIDYLVFRRDVLDWRDRFHARSTQTATELRDAFALIVRQNLAEVSILRRLLTRTAPYMLQDHFIRTVRVPMFVAIRREQSELAALVEKWLPQTTIELTFPAPWSDSECDCLGDLSFTPSNLEKILAKMDGLILGDNGIADTYRARATQLARKIIEERAC